MNTPAGETARDPRNQTDAEPRSATSAPSLDSGPVLEFPVWRTVAAVVLAAAAVSLAAWPIVTSLRPAGVNAIMGGAASVVGAFLVGLLVMRPWKPRPMGRWMVTWLAGRGVCFIAVLAIGGLLYSAARVDAAVFWLTLGAGYFVALLAEALVFASTLKSGSGGHAV